MFRNRGFICVAIVLGWVLSACDSTPPTTLGTTTTTTAIPTIRWMVGLGGGAEPNQVASAQEIVQAFNDDHPQLRLVLEVVDPTHAYTTLADQIAAGTPPDIVGPLGRDGANTFADHFLDLRALIEGNQVDLTVWPATVLEAGIEADGSVLGLPFATYPSFLYFNRDLFDEAGLPYPPERPGEIYGADTPWEGEWDWDKLSEIAKQLTIDGRGRRAGTSGFQRFSTVQWGFMWQWTTRLFQQGSFWGAGYPMLADGTAAMPEAWVEEWDWYHQAIWKHGFAPNENQLYTLDPGGNAFATGKVAMAASHLWYVCCVREEDGTGMDFFDIAVLPANGQTVTANLHVDTFYILETTPHPQQAFEVLMFLLDSEPTTQNLINIYGAHPANTDLEDPFFSYLETVFPQGVRWNVARDADEIADVPSHERWLPGWDAYKQRLGDLELAILSDPNLDLDEAITALEEDLTAIFAAGGPASPDPTGNEDPGATKPS